MFLLSVLYLVHVTQLVHYHPHYGELQHPNELLFWKSSLVFDLKQKMYIDPATLTNPEDFTRFLTIICGKTTDAFLKDERDHTNDKIRIVVHSFAEKIESLKKDYETKIDSLEKHVNELITEANLKTDTLSVYQNQLLFNLKSGLQGALANVDQDIRVLSNEIRTCNICSKHFGTLEDLQSHILYEHSLHSSFQCQVCRKSFSSFNELNVHSLEHVAHPSVDPNDLSIDPETENSYTEPVCQDTHHCCICDEIFTTFNDLSNHTKKVHICYPAICQGCGKSLQFQLILQRINISTKKDLNILNIRKQNSK